MDARNDKGAAKNRTTVEQKSDREVVVRRIFDGPARIVFEAWTRPELFRKWWAPKSMDMSIVSCAMDVRAGGGYRLEIKHPAAPQPVAFFGKYLKVTPPARLVWTNDEGGGEGSTTTVTFEEKRGRTLVVLSELYPSKEAFEASGGAADALPEQFEQLDALLAELGANA